MNRLLPTTHRVPMHGVRASRLVEAAALAHCPPHALMRRAGQAVARLALAVAPHARRVWIAAGPGNNGGDGLEAAVHLLAAHRDVRVTLLQGRGPGPADAADALARARTAGVPVTVCSPDSSCDEPDDDWRPDLVIDALLGIGVSRGPQGELARLIDRVNAAGCTVLAVDTPSGLNVDNGQPVGEHCVLAQHTLSLLTVKTGLFTGVGREQSGAVWFDRLVTASAESTHADVDPGGVEVDAWLTGGRGVLDALPQRSQSLHKGSFGDVAMVGGGPGMTGAALLSARSAHASGAGKVFVDLLDSKGPTFDVVRPELMFRPGWHLGDDKAVRTAVVVCGCGAGAAAAQALPRLLGLTRRLVLDADALNEIARDEALQAQLAGRLTRGLLTVMTPHPLEASRLAGIPTQELQDDRLASAQKLANRFQCVVVLKGSGTVIAAPGRRTHVNPTGNAALATGGTGDVLAGWVAGSWAQFPWEQSSDADLQPAAADDIPGRSDATECALSTAFDVAVGAVYVHGAAAEQTGGSVMRAADLIDAMMRWKQSRSGDAGTAGKPG